MIVFTIIGLIVYAVACFWVGYYGAWANDLHGRMAQIDRSCDQVAYELDVLVKLLPREAK